MAVASVPVDLLNPGQVFACLGLMELSEVLCGRSEAAFDWRHPGDCRFVLRSESANDPVAAALHFLEAAEVGSLVPPGTDMSTEKWSVSSNVCQPPGTFPVPVPSSPAALPAVLRAGDRSIVISSWGEGRNPDVLGTGRDNIKFWAGSGGYPGAAFLRDALDAARPKIATHRADPFSLSAPQSSSLRFDWRRDYIPIDIGFSLNEHGSMQPLGYPLVEVLAAIGLTHARPQRQTKLQYRYAVVSTPELTDSGDSLLPPSFVRAALGAATLPFPTRSFTMHLNWPGQENQARCITTVHEETN